MNAKLLAGCLLLCACSGGNSDKTPAYTVGAFLGGGSFLFGSDSSGCTYRALPSVAEIGASGTMAKLVGEGTVFKACGETRTSIQVLQPTTARIDGPARVVVGGVQEDSYRAKVLARGRELEGAVQGAVQPEWTLGEDCKGVAVFKPVLGSQDTGGPSIVRELDAATPGKCTLKVSLLGVSAERTISIE